MPTTRDDTRARILKTAYALLYRQGFARTSMDQIADAAGLTKRSLYYHFDSKDAVVEAVLEAQRTHALDQVRRWDAEPTDDPARFSDGLFARLREWSGGRGFLGSGFTRLTMELADLPGHPARRVAHRHKDEVEAWLAQRLTAMGVAQPDRAARQTVLLFEGAISLALIHGDSAYVEAAAAANRVLLSPPTTGVTSRRQGPRRGRNR
jgi:AcrR family transcriptional regulator